MNKARTSVISAVFLFLRRNDQLLMMRRYNTGYGDGFYSFVAGHVEGRETFRQTIIREAKEEIGIDIHAAALRVLHVSLRYVINEGHRIDIFMTTDVWQGTPRNMEPHKCDQIDWFSSDNVPNNTIPYIKHAIHKIKQGIFYSEFGFD